eukprot:g62858.t1
MTPNYCDCADCCDEHKLANCKS